MVNNKIKKKKIQNFQRRKTRVKFSISQDSGHPRLSVYRSNKHIRAQIIDDNKGVTLCAVSEKDLNDKQKKLKKTEQAAALGEVLAKKALDKKIVKVVFDRSGYKYHGRVKALADAARQAGLEF